MPTHSNRNEPCPCGSGRKYKHCCEGKQEFLPGRFKGVPYWVIGVIAVGVIGGGLWVVSEMVGAPGGRVAATAQGPPGTPWEYDAANDRYWDPDHGHWHDGRPPTDRAAGNPSVTPSPAVRPPGAASPFGTLPGGQSLLPGSEPAHTSTPLDPSKPPPKPWEFDAAANKHFDPVHAHWHDGPAPWQYDPATNKHWEPTHGHWHDGPVPEGASYPDGQPVRSGP